MSVGALFEAMGRWSTYDLGSPEHAWLFWLLAAGLVWGALRYGWGQRLALPLGRAEGGAGWLRWAAPLPRLLRYLGLAFLLLALLRPQTVRQSSQTDVQSLDIYLALDVSGSMLTKDLKPNRVEAAKETLRHFVDGLAGDRLGLVVFAGKAFVQCPLSLDHEVVKQFITQVDIGTVGMDGTAIGDALLLATARLAEEKGAKDKVIVLATDGINNTGVDPAQAGNLAAGLGVRVYTVGLGQRGGAYLGQLGGFAQAPKDPGDLAAWTSAKARAQSAVSVHDDEPDEPLLRAIAAKTGGRYFRAADSRELEGIYEQIGSLERHAVKVKQHRDADDHFYPFLLAGALLLLAEALLRIRLRVTA